MGEFKPSDIGLDTGMQDLADTVLQGAANIIGAAVMGLDWMYRTRSERAEAPRWTFGDAIEFGATLAFAVGEEAADFTKRTISRIKKSGNELVNQSGIAMFESSL